jgi:hypothetical protein
MSRRRYIAWNFAMPTTGEPSFVTTPTTLTTGATLLQIKPTTNCAIIAWGFQTNVVPTALVNIDLLTTGTVGATVTNYAAADIMKYDDSGSSASLIATGGGNTSGFTSTAEGTITATRYLDQGPGWSQFYKTQEPLDREASVQAGDFLRIRAWSATAIGIKCFVVWEE